MLRQGIDRFQAEPDKNRALLLSRQYLLQGEGKRVMDLIRDEVYGMHAARARAARPAGRGLARQCPHRARQHR